MTSLNFRQFLYPIPFVFMSQYYCHKIRDTFRPKSFMDDPKVKNINTVKLGYNELAVITNKMFAISMKFH